MICWMNYVYIIILVKIKELVNYLVQEWKDPYCLLLLIVVLKDFVKDTLHKFDCILISLNKNLLHNLEND